MILKTMELTILMPCLNEAETIATCIDKAFSFMEREKISGEVLISDNGSTDGSQEIASRKGARLVNAETKGYGAALITGINSARGKYIIMGDADDSYDFSDLNPFLEKLRQGSDVVVGNRFKGGIKKGAMPFLHRYLGNPVLSFLGRLFFGIKIRDFHCGLRGFSKDAYNKMNLNTVGMEFASEMIVKSALYKLKIAEVPTSLSPDGRSRPPHLRTWHDGWRHLRFLLMFSPKWLFLYPGLFLITFSTIFGSIIYLNPIEIRGVMFDIHTLIILSFFLLAGIQFVFFHFFSKIYCIARGIIPSDRKIESFHKNFTLERGLLIGSLIFSIGAFLLVKDFMSWRLTGYNDLIPQLFVRKIIAGCLTFFTGIQIIMFSFILSILDLKTNK